MSRFPTRRSFLQKFSSTSAGLLALPWLNTALLQQIEQLAINNPSVKGVRVTPHLYNRLEDLDRFVEVVRELAEG
jgi:selenocysteine lyase/cysteine desulfurase